MVNQVGGLQQMAYKNIKDMLFAAHQQATLAQTTPSLAIV